MTFSVLLLFHRSCNFFGAVGKRNLALSFRHSDQPASMAILPGWYSRPNQEGRINRKPDDEKKDQTITKETKIQKTIRSKK